MQIIAVTGGLASGKSTVANIFHKKYNIPIIDTDKLAREVINTDILNIIVKKFGISILNSDNTLDRKKLSKIVFNNKEDKSWLEQLLHPLINQQIKIHLNKLKSENKYNYILILIPLLTKDYLKQNNYINKVLVIDCDENIQIQRAMTRDKQNIDQIKKIINSQISRTERLQLADDIITNNNNKLERLELEVDKLHQLYTA